MNTMSRWQARLAAALALALAVGALAAVFPPSAARAAEFPKIPVWAYVGAFQDYSHSDSARSAPCLGALRIRPDSLARQARTISIRFLRDRLVESRPDFGGYRIYRMINTPDPTQAVLLRRYSVNAGSELTWNFSKVDPGTKEFTCPLGVGGSIVVHDSVITFMDPDSSGNWVKVCKYPLPSGGCAIPGDSVFKLVAPPGPHDGFRTYYSITYEARDGGDPAYADLFVPDSSSGSFALCDTTGLGRVRAGLDSTGTLYAHMVNSCPNLNNKLNNLVGPVEPSGGPAVDLERVGVVPNPYRAREAWDLDGKNEIHFINLPKQSTIKIFTVSGDLVRVLNHDDPVRDFERWDLNSGASQTVASGIYIYRVTAPSYSFQDRFIVIR
jgi:hypothetical protein